MKDGIEGPNNFNIQPVDREAIPNAESALPHVSFKEGRLSTIEGKTYQEIDITDENGAVIGDFTLETEGNGAIACIADIKLNEENKGKGYGRAVYIKLIQDLSSKGIKLISGSELSRQAIPVWEWLVKKGYARKTLTGHRDETKQNIAYSTEKYEVLI